MCLTMKMFVDHYVKYKWDPGDTFNLIISSAYTIIKICANQCTSEDLDEFEKISLDIIRRTFQERRQKLLEEQLAQTTQ